MKRNKGGITVGEKKYAKLCGTLNTLYPELSADDGLRKIRDGKQVYTVSADGYGGMIIHRIKKL